MNSALEDFLKNFNPSAHHLDSYNTFIVHELPLLIKEMSTKFSTFSAAGEEKKYEIIFENARVPPASIFENGRWRPLTPRECLLKDLTYSAPIYASVAQTRMNAAGDVEDIKVINKAVIAQIPVMTRSVLCNNRKKLDDPIDSGGYFIINGVERVLVTQQRNCYNTVHVAEDKNNFTASMRSISEETNHSVMVSLSMSNVNAISESNIVISLPYLSKSIPLIIFFRALGVGEPEDVYARIGFENALLRQNIQKMFRAGAAMTRDEALTWIGQFATKKAAPPDEEDDEGGAAADNDDLPTNEDEDDVLSADSDDNSDFESENAESVGGAIDPEDTRRHNYATQIIETEMFPHLGINATFEMRMDVLFLMLRRLLMTKLGALRVSERDNLATKRFENSGTLIYELYKVLFKNFLNTARDNHGKNGSLVDLINHMDTFVTKNVKYCFATGNWGIQKNAYVRQGVSQVLNRLSFLGTLSHLQRVNIPIGKEGKNVKIRLIQPSYFGYICLFETPEGKACGIVMNLTISTQITKHYSTNRMRDFIKKYFAAELSARARDVDLWINNTIRMRLGGASGAQIVEKLRALRRARMLPRDVSIAPLGAREIYIFSDRGRLTRPLSDRRGGLDWIDPAEAQSLTVAMFPRESAETFSHCEIHPALLFGICSGAIPFSDHNQSPRNVYETSMMKQAIGMFAINYVERYDTIAEVLDYPQKALVSTVIGRAVGMHERPAGINCIVAIATLGSWNAEDSIILNRAAIERGLFVSTSYRTVTVEEYKTKTNAVKKFCLPEPHLRREYNYDLLDERGIVKRGSYVRKKDVIVGRVYDKKDCSELSDEEGIVEQVQVFRTPSGYLMAKIVFKVRKIPERGDKFANLSAQKGTCGMVMNPEDLPFTDEGIVPDVIINPNAIPSRMTISMLLEMVIGKEGLERGELADATPFSEFSTDIGSRIGETLRAQGFDSMGWETMYSGTTGEPLRARIFMGSSYYQKLKHMVADKMHARAFGNVTTLTRQPLAGRSKEGGLRLGEMERDSLISQGSLQFLKERLFDMSDPFSILVCSSCGVVSNHKDECHVCHNTQLANMQIPFAAKLMFQQLNACLIGSKYKTELI